MPTRGINNIVKSAYSANDGARELQFGLLDSRDDGEHDGVDSVELLKISATHDKCFYGKASFDGLWYILMRFAQR